MNIIELIQDMKEKLRATLYTINYKTHVEFILLIPYSPALWDYDYTPVYILADEWGWELSNKLIIVVHKEDV